MSVERRKAKLNLTVCVNGEAMPILAQSYETASAATMRRRTESEELLPVLAEHTQDGARGGRAGSDSKAVT